VIDPLREVQSYVDKAEKNGASIKYVLETHFHADFVSGHLDLANKTGAKIVFGPNANPNFEAYIAKDEEILTLGKLKIKVLHTPGHTFESTCYLLIDENDAPYCVFTGDTLFIGDVGRPDLAQKSNITERDLAAMLYNSLNTKLKVLPDHVIVYPAHGAGSACGKNMSKETWDTIGNQKRVNYALLAETETQFIDEVTAGLSAPPYYFPKNVMLNKMGYESFDAVMERSAKPLNPREVEFLVESEGVLILDTRHQDDFVKTFVPRSIFIGIGGDFAPWVGTLIRDIHQPLVIIATEGREEEVITRLSRVGYDNVLGYLKGGLNAWVAEGYEVDSISSVSASELAELMKAETLNVYDVRKQGEYDAEHIDNVNFTPLSNLNDYLSAYSDEGLNYVHCAGGYRSVIAISILKARGIHNVVNILGGFKAIAETGTICTTDFVCSSVK
jgi:glyoxylase-like metal-dependent hydrolase (beta-lactamase superfamily II)/rhodanese-related sulfurtransferase